MAPVTPECVRATGSLSIAPMTFFADKDTFTLNDGVNAATVFEFDLESAPGVTSGHEAIVFAGSENQFQMATKIKAAIDSVHDAGTLRIAAAIPLADAAQTGAAGSAGATGGGGAPAATGGASTAGEGGSANLDEAAVIDLVNDLAGALGNVKIKDTVGNPGFKPSGMTGGKAVACDSPASCSTDDECASATCGDDHICK